MTNFGQDKSSEDSQTDMIDFNLESTPDDYGYPAEFLFSANNNDPGKS